ncbi:MAG TPA: NAD(P)/FAD-dependent oxidoreductase, partial [Solirubrobacterales bacterium]|nr:NAD(P)/FAD-dependent oxidoreductase [Solirubrobacterales bacterium]
MSANTTYDVAIVGGGHNGLVAAYYLAREGLRVVVCERREIVGGCCVTEEFAPGYRASTGAYVLSMLREPIWKDMRLVERGIVVDPAGPSLHLFADGTRLLLSEETAAAQAAVRELSAADAAALAKFEDDLAEIAQLVTPLIDETPPDVRPRHPGELGSLLKLGGLAARKRALINEALFLFSTSVTQFLDERFESDHVKAALGWHAINDSISGPSTPGTAYILLHDHASEDAGGGARSWGFVRGGIGRVTEAMADAAREAGAEIRTEAEVERVLVAGDRAVGLELADGSELRAARVLSNADPKKTFLGMLDAGELPAGFRASV